MADIKFIENIKSKFSLPPENDKIYITVLLKLVIYEQLCRFSSRIIDEKFLHNSRTHDKQTFLEVARGIMNITELVSVNDWKKYFNKYFDELKIIFPNIEEQDLKKMWQAACRLSIFLDAQKMTFDFENNRLRTLRNDNKKTNSKKRSSKKIDSELFTDGKFCFYDLVILMDILQIGESVDSEDYIGIKRIMRQFEKSKKENNKNEKNEIEKARRRTIYKLFDGIAIYSSDLIVAHLKQIFILRKLLYITSNENLLEKINLWNQSHLNMFEEMFKSNVMSFAFVYKLCSYWTDYLASVNQQKIFENEEELMSKAIVDKKLSIASLSETLM